MAWNIKYGILKRNNVLQLFCHPIIFTELNGQSTTTHYKYYKALYCRNAISKGLINPFWNSQNKVKFIRCVSLATELLQQLFMCQYIPKIIFILYQMVHMAGTQTLRPSFSACFWDFSLIHYHVFFCNASETHIWS